MLRSQSRNPSANKKTFEANLEAVLTLRFGRCQISNYAPKADCKVWEITEAIRHSSRYDVLCIAIGVNDLVAQRTGLIVDVCKHYFSFFFVISSAHRADMSSRGITDSSSH